MWMFSSEGVQPNVKINGPVNSNMYLNMKQHGIISLLAFVNQSFIFILYTAKPEKKIL